MAVKCPLCDVKMREVERRGVLIDVCPECKGIWLDKGELEKLLSASREEAEAVLPGEDRWSSSYRGYEQPTPYKKKHKRRSFLEEVFDIFD